jgi:CRP-like cAMP-binding protein
MSSTLSHAGDRPAEQPIAGRASIANRLLRALPPDDYAMVAASLAPIELPRGTVLYTPGTTFTHVYFPETCVLSLILRFLGGAAAEAGTVGNDGMVGLSALLDADAETTEVVAQIPGRALSMSVHAFREARLRPAFDRLLRRYAHAYMTQVSQTAGCNAIHDVGQRCARWILMTHDRVNRTAGTIPLTHDFLAAMLAVRRASVTEAAQELQRAGLIAYTRGQLRVVDRSGLERASCECYATVHDHFARLFGGPATPGS